MASLQGQLLVASPHLGDGNFYRSVVLMVRHDDEGALGLLLNRPTSNTINEVWRLVAEEEMPSDRPLYLGGPVAGPLVALHRIKACAEAEVLPGVYFAAHKDQLLKVVSHTTKPFRLFTGYAGWAAGQLEAELRAGGWLSVPATKDLVFYEPDDLWEHLVRSIGESILGPALKTKHVPEDPSLN
ncbi:MAG: YqgE/AlgH family protein [Pirellulaceae bacterium]